MGDASVNIVPPFAAAKDASSSQWEQWRSKNSTGSFHVVEEKGEAVGLRIADHAGRLAWRSNPRRIEPRREYRLEARVCGSARLMMRWVRLEKSWDEPENGKFSMLEVQLGEIRSDVVTEENWEHVVVGDVAPREATHCRIFLEAAGTAAGTEFRDVFLDGLSVNPLEIQFCHAGYHSAAPKTAIIQLREEAKGGRFLLVDQTGKEAYSEELTPLDHTAWGRRYWLADFSTFDQEGTYALAVEIAGLRKRTKFFQIWDDLYGNLNRLALEWFATQRCGLAVPDWHGPCHLDDGVLRSGDELEDFCDVVGGWHDSGSYDKWTQNIWIAIHALTHVFERGIDVQPTGEGQLPVMLAECRWGAEYLLKIALPDGRFYSSVRSDRRHEYFGPPEGETDNERESADERTIGPPCNWIVAALTSYSLANFARVLHQFDPEMADRCLQTALKTYQALAESKDTADPVDLHAAAALLCIGLWRARGEEQYREECSWRILSILQLQTEEGIFTSSKNYRRRLMLNAEQRVALPGMRDPDMDVEYAPAPFLYLHALLCYLERRIDDALALEIRGALDKFFTIVKKCASVSPFGHMGEFTIADEPAYFPILPKGHNSYFLSLAYMLAKAAIVLNRPDLGSIAQRQYEWVLGRNIRGTCMVCGAGHKELNACYTKLAMGEDHYTGFQPGAVVNGIYAGDGKDMPFDFPCLDIHSSSPEGIHNGLDADHRSNEPWLPNTAWFILAGGEITKMLSRNASTQQE